MGIRKKNRTNTQQRMKIMMWIKTRTRPKMKMMIWKKTWTKKKSMKLKTMVRIKRRTRVIIKMKVLHQNKYREEDTKWRGEDIKTVRVWDRGEDSRTEDNEKEGGISEETKVEGEKRRRRHYQ